MKSIIYITFLILKNYGNSREISRRKRSWLSSSSIDSIRASISSSSALSWTSSWKRGKVVSFISKIRVRFGYQKCSKKRPTRLIYFLACFTFWPIFRKIITNCDCSISVLWKYFSSLRKPFLIRTALLYLKKNKWKNRSFFSLLRQTAMQNYLLCSRISFHQFEALMNLYHHFRVFDHFHRCLVILAMVWYMIREDSIVPN